MTDLLTGDDLLSRAERVAVPDGSMRVVSPVDALLIACIHRAAHHRDADDLIWIYDIHLIAGRLNAEDWARFVELAAERQVSQLCARGLQLSAHCFHTHIHEGVRDRLSGKDEASSIFLRRDLRPIDGVVADLRVLSPRQRAALLREHLFPPSSYITQKYRVRHRALLPMYYAYRVVVGAARFLRSPHVSGDTGPRAGSTGSAP